MTIQQKRSAIILAVAATILLLPIAAMQFTNDVKWTPVDFFMMAILLFGVGLTCELVMRKVKNMQKRVWICLAVLVLFLLVWAELAVGIFGTPFAGS